MEKENPVRDKSYRFALRIIQVTRDLRKTQEYDLLRQLQRSGTSIGANVEEACAAQSKRDFITKMSIASKEARESDYWLRLLRDSEILEQRVANELLQICAEIIRLLTVIVKTSQARINGI